MDKVKNLADGQKINYEMMSNIKSDVIMDRYYMEEVVYAPVYRNYKADYIEHLEKELISKFNVVLVYTYASQDAIESRFDLRGEDSTRKQDIPHLKEHYNSFLESTLISNKITINTTTDLNPNDYKDILDNINCNIN